MQTYIFRPALPIFFNIVCRIWNISNVYDRVQTYIISCDIKTLYFITIKQIKFKLNLHLYCSEKT